MPRAKAPAPAQERVQRDRTGRVLIVLLTIAIAVLALAPAGTRVLALHRQLTSGAQHLQAAESLLSGATAGGQSFQISLAELNQADADLAQAEAEMNSAQRDLSQLALPLALVRRLPFVGGTAAALPETVNFASAATKGARELVAGLRPLAQERAVPTANQPAAERLTDALSAGQASFDAAQRDLNQAELDRQGIHANAVLPLLRSALAPLSQWDRQWPAISADLSLLVQLPPVLHAVLGYNGPRAYAILGQNSAELRPTGGFLGSMGIVHVANGTITQQSYQSIYDYDPDIKGTKRPTPPAPQPIVDHLGIAGWHIEDANWSPDFPTTAQDVRSFLAYDTGEQVNGVIAFDSNAVEDVLQVLGPIDVKVGGQMQQFTAADWQRLSTQLIYFDPATSNAADSKQVVLAPLLSAFITRLNSASGSELTGVVQTLRRAIADRHIFFQFDDPVAAGFIAGYHADGSLTQTPGQTTVYPVEANLSYTKIGPFIHENTLYELWFDAAGVCRKAQLRLTWQNTVTKAQIADPVNRIGGQEWSMAQHKLIDMPGAYGFYERIYTPGGTSFLQAGGLQEPVTQSRDGAFTVFGTYLTIPAGQSHELDLTLALPDREPAPGHFVLNLPNQPGTQGRGLTVIIHAASGSAPASNLALKKTGNQIYQYTGIQNKPLQLDLRLAP